MRTRSEGCGLADAVWYGHVTEADVEEIIESHILGGKPVERLRLADFCLNTASCEHGKSLKCGRARSRRHSAVWRITKKLVGAAGFEPATAGLEIRCSIRLSYAPRGDYNRPTHSFYIS